MVTGLCAASAKLGFTAGRIAWRADEVSWAIKMGLPIDERATEALELEMARSMERAAALRYSMAWGELFVGSRVSTSQERKASGTARPEG